MSIPTAPPKLVEALTDQAARAGVLAVWLAQLEAALTARPGDAALSWRRAELLRALGQLEAAATAYEGLAAPAGPALAALLRGGEASPAARGGPARFLRFDDFLDAERYQDLRDLAAADARLSPALVGAAEKARLDEGMRHAAVLDDASAVRPWFLDRLRVLVQNERVVARLGLPDFTIGRCELQVTCHLGGGFFRPHRDADDAGGPTGWRRLTYVYYFHRLPRRFDGGDLLLYDQGADGRRQGEFGFTRLVPVDNSLVMFASDRLHAVTPVAMASGDALDGRWTVNGWLHAG